MDAREIIDRFSEEQGWNTDTQVDLFSNFVNEHRLCQELEAFLRDIADEENEYSSEEQ